MKKPPALNEIDLMFRAFSDPTRLRILHVLHQRETCVGDLVQILELPQAKTSRHLAYLRKSGFVNVRKNGLWSYYSLASAKNDLHTNLLSCLTACFRDVPEIKADAERGKENQKIRRLLSLLRRNDMRDSVMDKVRANYAAVAVSGLSSGHAGVRSIAQAFGYSAEELESIPAEANMGLSCGNPLAAASLRPSEFVVDLGCGGGLDVLLAAQRVGPAGKAIGIDMTPEMIVLARSNAARQGVGNVEFHQSTIDRLPLADASVDCVISNCVVNLAPDKRAVFREIFRVLKPGGRVAISDIALKKALPTELQDNLLAYVGCISGAIFIKDYERGLLDAGFQAVRVVDAGKDLRAYAALENQGGCCTPLAPESGLPIVQDPCSDDRLLATLAELCRKYDFNEFAASVQVYAVKA